MKILDNFILLIVTLLAPFGGRTMAQAPSPDDLARRTIERRAVEAVIWGMAAVNIDLMLQAMLNSTNAKVNEVVY